jgi:hypothetical protein
MNIFFITIAFYSMNYATNKKNSLIIKQYIKQKR